MSEIRLAIAGLLLCLPPLVCIACSAGETPGSPPRQAVTPIEPTDGTGAPATASGVVPDVVCKDLQTAQDAMQAAGFYNLTSEDATGQGRQQLVDRNWVVVKQSVAADSRPEPLTRILLSAVKFGEPTGASGCRS